MLLEVCIDRVESAKNAEKGGAGRVELCDNLIDGGTTPSCGMIQQVQKSINIPVNVIIRPRGGDFYYNEDEMEVMLEDIRACKRIGVHGVVIGCLTKEGTIDMEKNRRLIEEARPLRHCLFNSLIVSVTFHRAIDMTVDLLEATKQCIELGVDRILTSGGSNTVMQGKDTIKQMRELAGDRLVIMAGGGVTQSNIRELVEYTGIKEVHGSARDYVESEMVYRKENVFMGGEKKNTQELEFKWKQTSEEVVKEFVAQIVDLYDCLLYQKMSEESGDITVSKSIIQYKTPWTIYGIDWCSYDSSFNRQRVLLSSYKQSYSNSIQIVSLDHEKQTFEMLYELNTMYPPTKVMWIPDPQRFHNDVFAFSGDYLRIYRLDGETSCPIVDAILNKDNSPDRCSPVTSFDWNRFQCNLIASTTLDSICTLWDLETQQAVAKVKSHSSEVYDISFSTNNENTYITCGGDGSIRFFDMRCVRQFSVLYENPSNAVLRASWDEKNSSTIAFIQKDDKDLHLIDIRNPASSLPLHAHTGAVNAFSWSPVTSQYVVSVGEDSHCYIWDFDKLSEDRDFTPSLVYDTTSAINNVKWCKHIPSWISLCYGNVLELCHTLNV